MAPSKATRYKVASISAYEILHNKTNKECEVDYCFDLNKTKIHSLKVTEQDAGTFYEKFCELFNLVCQNTSMENASEIFNTFSTNAIAYGFIDVDFGNMLEGLEDENDPKALSVKSLIEKGFIIKNYYDNPLFYIPNFSLNQKDGILYKPFLTSSSKVKKHRVLFINNVYEEILNTMFNMGLDMSKIPEMNISKFNAYRGLYLTDGYFLKADNRKVLMPDGKLHVEGKLSAENVLILKDEKLEQLANFITAKNKNNSPTEWELENKYDTPISFEPFDGQGLISGDLLFFYEDFDEKEYDIYQVRLPYAKGVLHRFDIQQFISEFFRDQKLYIEDFWGIKRDLRKVQLIAGSSFFKCAKWLAKGYGIDNPSIENDPLQTYFDNFYKYHFNIVICNTEETYNNETGLTRLGYQILNTIDMSQSEFRGFVEDNLHLGDIEISKDNLENFPELKKYKIFNGNLYDLLKINDNFASESKVKNLYSTRKKIQLKDIAKGRIFVPGQRRFLARDLIAFMYCVLTHAKTENDSSPTDIIDSIKKQLMPVGYFYAPNMNLVNDNVYAMYRDPHLSRNEQVASKAFEPDEGSIYYRYLADKNTVCFMPLYSLDPLTLGGADFDGDTVTVVTEKRFINAVVRGAYNYDGNELQRKIPIEVIPSTKDIFEEKIPSSIQLNSLIKSFDSKIGIISNKALQVGALEYFSEKDNPKYINQSAFAAILSGLSIDAAKSGSTPSTKPIDDLISKKKSQYKKKLESISRLEISKIKDVVLTESSYIIKSNKVKDIIVPLSNENSTNLDLLLNIFCEQLKCSQKNSIAKSENASTDKALFKLETEDYYKKLSNGNVKIFIHPFNNSVLFDFEKDDFLESFQKINTGKTFSQVFDFLKNEALNVDVQVSTNKANKLIAINYNESITSKYKSFEWKKHSNEEHVNAATKIKKARTEFDKFKNKNKKSVNKYHKTIHESLRTRLDKDDIEKYIEEYTFFFNQFFENKEKLEDIWDYAIFANWKYMSYEDRKMFLSDIGIYSDDNCDIDDDYITLSPEAFDLLIDFKASGYMLFLIMMKSCYIDLQNDELISEISNKINEVSTGDCNYDIDCYTKMLNAYIQHIKNPASSDNDLQKTIDRIENKSLKELFKEYFENYSNEQALNYSVIDMKAAGYEACEMIEIMGADFIDNCIVNQSELRIENPNDYDRRIQRLTELFTHPCILKDLPSSKNQCLLYFDDLWDVLDLELIIKYAARFEKCKTFNFNNSIISLSNNWLSDYIMYL